MTWRSSRAVYAGAFLLVCLVLGGGTQKGLPTVFAIEILALPLLVVLLLGQREQRAVQLPLMPLTLLVVATFALQFLPNPFSGGLISRDPGRTLDTFIFTVTGLTLFYSFGSLDAHDRNRMTAWFLAGVILNAALALMQFAASRALANDFFPYALSAGFFANENHFTALLYVAIPFVVYQFDVVGRLYWASLIVAFIVFLEFAAGSVAGILLSVASAMVSLALVARVAPLVRATLIGTALIGAVIIALNPANMLHIRPDDPRDRPAIALSTLRAIAINLPLGSGYGTFDIVYPSVETDTDIRDVYINHAHNEVLELLLEGGIPAALCMVAYLALLVRRYFAVRHSQLSMAALCGIAFLLVHSLVDYPLRTAALSAVFALCNAIYFAPVTEGGQVRPRRISAAGSERHRRQRLLSR